MQFRNPAEAIRAIRDFEKIIAPVRFLLLKVDAKMAEEAKRAALNDANFSMELANDFTPEDGLTDVSVNILQKIYVKLRDAKRIKYEVAPAPKFVERSSTGKVNHAHPVRDEAAEQHHNNQRKQEEAVSAAKAQEIWSDNIRFAESYRHGTGRNHSRSQQGIRILTDVIHKAKFKNESNERAAIDCGREIQKRARQLDEELGY